MTISVLVLPSTASADPGGCLGYLGDAIGCGGTTTVIDVPTPTQPGSVSGGGPAGVPIPPQDIYYSPDLVSDGKGGYCITFTQETGPNVANTLGPAADQLTLTLLRTYGLCPDAVVPPTVAANPAVIATQFWQTIPLPVPRPTIPPGFAVTGKLAYLVTGGTVSPPAYTEATPLGPLSITARGSYSVAWGDGATTGPFTVEGGPYPSGTITHTYDTVGTVQVDVVERWTATWTLGGAGGTLQQLETRAAIPGLEVQQIQAVISQ